MAKFNNREIKWGWGLIGRVPSCVSRYRRADRGKYSIMENEAIFQGYYSSCDLLGDYDEANRYTATPSTEAESKMAQKWRTAYAWKSPIRKP